MAEQSRTAVLVTPTRITATVDAASRLMGGEFNFLGIARHGRLRRVDHGEPDTVGAEIQVIKEHANGCVGTRALCRRRHVVVGIADRAIVLNHRHHANAPGTPDEQIRVAPDRSKPAQKYRQRLLCKGDDHQVIALMTKSVNRPCCRHVIVCNRSR